MPNDNDLSANMQSPIRFDSIPKLRRVLIAHQSHLRSVLNNLVAYNRAARMEVTDDMAEPLACAALDLEYPRLETDDDPLFSITLITAMQGGLRTHTDLAIENVKTALRVTISGLESLNLIYALDEDVQPEWHNLPPSLVARRLNAFGHALARGAIPGWDEGRR